MTSVLVRSALDDEPGDDPGPADTLLLDWAPGSSTATIQLGSHVPSFFSGRPPDRTAADVFLVAAAVYCTDKVVPRRSAPDAWTRTIELSVPVGDDGAWAQAGLDSVLNFLTGDRWRLSFRPSATHPTDGAAHLHDDAGSTDGQVRTATEDTAGGTDADVVCLFSGGLDSLCGAIDLLEADPNRHVCLVSHHEGGQAAAAQERLLAGMISHYGTDRITSRRLYLRPAPPNQSQYRPLPRPRENTTRSRSVLFLGSALALASTIGPQVPVYVPENGFIGINVPLTPARTGTASTRTTHPHLMAGFARAMSAIGMTNPIVNPYRVLTKGEMLARSSNPGLLKLLAPESVSCSHPETARFVGRAQGNCGYCFPCLIRRAALCHVGWDSDGYAWEALTEAPLLDGRTRGADLRAVVAGAFTPRPDRDALLSGPLPRGERDAFVSVWRRGLAELRDWLADGAGDELAKRIQALT